jgi:serine/threonine protein kinase
MPTIHAPRAASIASGDQDAKALAALSADDLLASDEGESLAAEEDADALPDEVHDAETIAMPKTTGQGTRAVTPAKAAEPPPKAAPAAARSQNGASAFGSSDDDEQSREVAASQKQRLKRIAQIASIKRYKIDRVLGRGGMATVYHATDTKTGESCALKLMEPHLADDAVFVERFKREIRACTALNHNNIVRVFDYGEEGGTYYMASEYVDGGTVASLLKAVDRAIPVALVVPMMIEFLDGLEHAHEQGFVHRDLKPANLMLTKKGEVKIGDFGIAKAQTDTTLTKTGALFGTPAYMSPEQAQGQELDTRSDLFGVGIIFYELLAGYNPFAHENPSTTMFAIAKGQVRQLFDANPNVPDAVDRVVHKLLEKDLKKRYQAAGHARDDLRMVDAMLKEKYPDAVALALADPVHQVDELGKAQSHLESERAQKLLQRNPPEHAEAAFRMYKATLLDAKNYDAVNTLTQLRADFGFRFTRPDDKQIQELEQALEKKPDQPAVLRRLADLSATHRNLVDMAGFMKRYLRFFPNDTHVLMKLERIIGNDPLAPFSILPERPADATDAWSADADMLDAARVAASEKDEPSLTPSGGGRAMRPAAKAGGAGPPTPTVPQSPTKQSSGSSALAKQTEQTAPVAASVHAALPPAKDSFELVIRMVKSFLEDIVRSFTGDQGIAAMKEQLKERFAADSGDLKDVAKAALGKGKEVVAESLLKQEGRKQLIQGGRSFVSKHWRLAAVVIGFLVLMSVAGKACAMACGSGPATLSPPVAQKRVGLGDVDDGLSPKKTSLFGKKKPVDAKPAEVKPAEVAKPVDAKPADTPPPPAMSPEEEARLLADKPATQAPVDAQTELNDKQEALKKKARATTDPKKAIEIYTQAIDVDPYSNASRDALLERAKLYQAQNSLDAAQDDLFRLKRRPDYAQVQAEVDQMLVDIAKAKKRVEPAPQ